MKPTTRLRSIRIWVALVACTVSVFGCKEPASPDAAPELIQDQPAVLQQGLNAYLIVSHTMQPVGGVVTVTANIGVLEGEATPTAFNASLRFNNERLEFLESIDLSDGALRFANPDAAPGVAKIAAAAPDGFSSEKLFSIYMKVLKPDYLEGLALDLHELGVVERGAANVAPEVHVNSSVGTEAPVMLPGPGG